MYLCAYIIKLIITSIKIIFLLLNEIFSLKYNKKCILAIILFFFYLSINLSILILNIILIKNHKKIEIIEQEKRLVAFFLFSDMIFEIINLVLLTVLQKKCIPCFKCVFLLLYQCIFSFMWIFLQ